MLNIQEIKTILKENNIAVLKKFGQNFLVSDGVLNKIIETASISPKDTVLEIGPGLGVLTFELAKKAKQIIAVEKDRKMAEILQKNLVKNNISNVEVINEDALNYQLPIIIRQPANQLSNYKIVANLPYNIATAVIMKFLESENPPQQIVVMVQKEVAQRIVATPPHMNKLAIFCQLYSIPKIIDIVPPTAFYPKPKIDSAILEFKAPSALNSRHSVNTRHSVPCMDTFQQIVNAGFIHPRKTLLNNFLTFYRGRSPGNFRGSSPVISKEEISQWLLQNNINPNQRAESLSLEQWQTLAKQYPQAS